MQLSGRIPRTSSCLFIYLLYRDSARHTVGPHPTDVTRMKLAPIREPLRAQSLQYVSLQYVAASLSMHEGNKADSDHAVPAVGIGLSTVGV